MAESVASVAEECFRVAGRAVTDTAITIRVDRKIIQYPDKYDNPDDKSGAKVWGTVRSYISSKEAEGYVFPEVPLFIEWPDDSAEDAGEAAPIRTPRASRKRAATRKRRG